MTEKTRDVQEEFEIDPIRKLRGLGKEVWAGIDPDVYVDELRSGCEVPNLSQKPHES